MGWRSGVSISATEVGWVDVDFANVFDVCEVAERSGAILVSDAKHIHCVIRCANYLLADTSCHNTPPASMSIALHSSNACLDMESRCAAGFRYDRVSLDT